MRFNGNLLSVLIVIFIVICMSFLLYVSYFDYKYRWFKRRYVLAFYPFVFIVNYLIVQNLLLTLISFFFLFLVFSITEIINPVEGIGTIDILIAPLFTTWLNFYSLYFIIIFLALYAISGVTFINKNIINRGKDTKSVPLVPVMLVSFIICCLLFTSNMSIFFSTILT